MSSTYVDILRDETLRIEIGPTAAADLAVENAELSTGVRTRAVRSSVIVRRADIPGLSGNQLPMGEVRLPDQVSLALRNAGVRAARRPTFLGRSCARSG
jgi:hypothetical protein